MADFSIRVTREGAVRWSPNLDDITVGTASPTSGGFVEVRIDRTNSGDITLTDILLALEKIEYYLKQHAFANTAPASGAISADD